MFWQVNFNFNQTFNPNFCLKNIILDLDDNWECTLGENNQSNSGSDESNVYGINNLGYVEQNSDEDDKDKVGEQNQIMPNLPNQMDSTIEKGSQEDSNENIVVVNNDNYDENNIEISDGYEPVPAVNKDDALDQPKPNLNSIDNGAEEIEASGDGPPEPTNIKMENKENYFAIPINSDPNTSVASHLQRLSQLIQSLSDSQHNQSQTYELGPNDLNNFLANHNIQSEYPSRITSNINRHPMPSDGKIHPDHMSEILQIQQKLQDLSNMVLTSSANTISTTTTTTTTMKPPSDSPNVEKYPEMTRIRVKNSSPIKTSKIDPGYSSSQIVVNRPEGSVLFSLPAGAHSQQTANEPVKNNPYISEETLKTMLELSKQMISGGQHQNQNSIPEQNYLQPIFRPIYYNIPIHELPIPILSTNVNEKPEKDIKKRKPTKDDTKDDTLTTYQNSDYIDNQMAGPSHYELVSDWAADDDNKKSDDHSTIIHNHIPITIEGSVSAAKPAPAKKYNSQSNNGATYTTEAAYNSFAQKPNNNYNNYVPVPVTNYNKPYEIKPSNENAYQSYEVQTPNNNNNYNQGQSNNGFASRPENTYSNYNQKPEVAYSVYLSKPSNGNYQSQSYNPNDAFAAYR